MANPTESSDGNILDDKTQQLSKKVWDLESKKDKVIHFGATPDIGAIRNLPNGTSFIGILNDGTTNDYKWQNGRLYKSGNYSEI